LLVIRESELFSDIQHIGYVDFLKLMRKVQATAYLTVNSFGTPRHVTDTEITTIVNPFRQRRDFMLTQTAANIKPIQSNAVQIGCVNIRAGVHFSHGGSFQNRVSETVYHHSSEWPNRVKPLATLIVSFFEVL
jgi:hypothetical protein